MEYGASAPQPERGITFIPEPVIPGDNELNLNVWTPELGSAGGLPVMVWIHGGGYVGGSNASPWYRGTSFTRDGIVVVSINYRLGAHGFLELRDAPANRAVRDWVAALRWVRDNVGAFGGDPDRVTIAGQSAGAGACATLLAVPAARGLFRGAVCMSGAARLLQTEEGVRAVGGDMAARLGVEPVRAAFEGVDPARLLEAQQAVAPLDPVAPGGPRLPWAPWVDGEVVDRHPLTAAADPTTAVPVLAGATAHEFNGSYRGGAAVTAEAVRAGLRAAGLDTPAADRYLDGHDPAAAAGQALTDILFRVPADRLVTAAAAGAAGFAYEFRWPSPVEPYRGLSCHCLDIPFVFDLLDAPGVTEAAGPAPPAALAWAMHRAWVRFVRDGDPGWPPYAPPGRPVMAFDEVSAIVEDAWGAERTMWSRGG